MWEYSNSTIAPLATIASLTASPSGLQGKSSKEPHPREAMIGAEEKQPSAGRYQEGKQMFVMLGILGMWHGYACLCYFY